MSRSDRWGAVSTIGLPDTLFHPYGMSPEDTSALRERMRVAPAGRSLPHGENNDGRQIEPTADVSVLPGRVAPASPVACASVAGHQALGSRYVLEHRISSGGMGTVWQGRDRATGLPVAVKLRTWLPEAR